MLIDKTGENVKVTACVCVCGGMHVKGNVYVSVCIRACVGYQCIHYPLLQTCIAHIFKIPLKTSHVSYAFILKGIYVHLCCK